MSTQLQQIIDLAIAMKADPYAHKTLAGPKSVALIFDKTSTRTRVSFSVGVLVMVLISGRFGLELATALSSRAFIVRAATAQRPG